MFRESESRVTMETRIQVQLCQEYRICSCESYTMSQTDTANSNQWRAVTFFHCHIPLDVASVVTSPFVCLSRQTPHSAESWGKKKVLHSSGSHQLLSWFVPQLQTFRAQVRVGARGCVYFPYGCSRSPLNKTVVPLLSKPTSFVSNEHLPGSLPTTAGFSVSLCQQPMTLILCFITPQRWAPNSSKEWLKYGEGLLCYTNKVVFVHNERTVDEALLCSSHRGF